MIFIYITCANKKEANKIGLVLLKARLAACVNIFPIDSLYLWQGKIAKDKEVVLIVKTLKRNFKKIESQVKKIHSYKTPCLCVLPVVKVNKGLCPKILRIFGNKTFTLLNNFFTKLPC